MVRHRLKGDDAPMIYFFSTCTETIRTLPALQHDEMRPEDVDTDGEDHAGDALRYFCMSRPAPGSMGGAKAPAKPWTMGWVKSQMSSQPRGVLAR